MESGKSKKKKKNVKCALCSKHLRVDSKSSHACSAHGNLVLFECGYCQRKFHGISRMTVRRHIHALHKNPDGRVDLNNFIDHKHLWQKEIKELRKTCFPVARKGEQEESDESLDEPFHVSRPRPELQCDLCKMILSNRCSVTNHACSHANLVIYQCEHCPRKFNGHDDRKSRSNRISRMDMTAKRTFKCALCSKILTNPYSMKSHAINVHGNLVLFECGYENCHQKFRKDNVNDVKDHIEEKNHMDQNGYVNVENFKDYRKELKMEMEKLKEKCFPVASNNSDMECVLCNFVLTRPRSMTNHACSHANFAFYECGHCPRKFNSHDDRTSVRKHIRNHHKVNGQLVSETDYKDNRKELADEIQFWKKKCFPNLN
ncbi:hypothetical protein CAEBREN_06545 [Caenorhabditis brenneri]|uniref:C2H2-type domain-containing protein n=1 Tax=Caenorhabditis brenneri TaxID=135651 RepID=G0NTL5_CAEBE|nr:hypothetical protein CAEBREN_06545 [Caenorhabditis brenneri]